MLDGNSLFHGYIRTPWAHTYYWLGVFPRLCFCRRCIIDMETTMRNIVELLAFHDERKIKSWLYHGFVLCEAGQFSLLMNELVEAKNESNCEFDKRIHFSELTSKSTGSSRTRTALRWVELFLKDLYKSMWFYFFGINLTNIDYEFFGSGDKDLKIYNRFFEIGLFSACRYFFDATTEDVEISQIFSEKRDLQKDDPFLSICRCQGIMSGLND